VDTFKEDEPVDLKAVAEKLKSMEKQTKIVNFLSAIDKKIKQCGIQIEKT